MHTNTLLNYPTTGVFFIVTQYSTVGSEKLGEEESSWGNTLEIMLGNQIVLHKHEIIWILQGFNKVE